jgi:hypothetical protein
MEEVLEGVGWLRFEIELRHEAILDFEYTILRGCAIIGEVCHSAVCTIRPVQPSMRYVTRARCSTPSTSTCQSCDPRRRGALHWPS